VHQLTERKIISVSLVMAERRIINLLRLLIKDLLRKKSCRIKSIIIAIFGYRHFARIFRPRIVELKKKFFFFISFRVIFFNKIYDSLY